MKNDDSLPQKNVCLIMMAVSSIVVKNTSVKIIFSTCYRRSACSQQEDSTFFFYTFTHAGLARKRKRKKKYCYASVPTMKREKKNVFCIILSKR
jgi:hypothetical protein